MKTRSLILVLAALVGAASCTTAPMAADEAKQAARVCLNANQLRNFDTLTDSHIYVRESRDKHYLLTMRIRCLNLRDALSIAISDTTNRVCSKGFGKVIYREGLSGRELQSCLIDTIESVNSKEHAKAIVKARTGPPEKQDPWTEEPVPE